MSGESPGKIRRYQDIRKSIGYKPSFKALGPLDALRFHSRELLDTVARGEEVVITFRGKPCAKLVPYEKEMGAENREENGLFGIWRDRDEICDVDEYVRDLRKSRY